MTAVQVRNAELLLAALGSDDSALRLGTLQTLPGPCCITLI